MDYMDVIGRSLRHAWRHKALWAFGFFACAAGGTNGVSFRGDADDLGWLRDFDPGFDPALIALLVAAVFALALVIWVASVLSEGALIHGICNAEQGWQVGFADCFSVGTAKFLRLLGIKFIAVLAVFSSVFTLIVFVVPSYFLSKGLGVLMTLIAIPALMAAILLVLCVEGWAIRFAVLYDRIWSSSISDGWRLFKANVGKSVGVAFSSLFSQMVLWCAVVIGMALLAIPFVIAAQSDPGSSLIAGSLLGVVLVVLACAVLGTFASSVWTLGFLRLMANEQGPANEPSPMG